MFTAWLLNGIDSGIHSTAAAMPAWTYSIDAGGWLNAVMSYVRQYNRLFPINDGIIPICGLYATFYVTIGVVRLSMWLISLIRGGGSPA